MSVAKCWIFSRREHPSPDASKIHISQTRPRTSDSYLTVEATPPWGCLTSLSNLACPRASIRVTHRSCVSSALPTSASCTPFASCSSLRLWSHLLCLSSLSLHNQRQEVLFKVHPALFPHLPGPRSNPPARTPAPAFAGSLCSLHPQPGAGYMLSIENPHWSIDPLKYDRKEQITDACNQLHRA